MPLPDNGAPWPPPAVAAALDVMGEWSAWYSGDPDQLSLHYAAYRGYERPADRTAQHRGGMVGKVARWWWGQPCTPGEARAKLHVPLAADIAGASADLLFAEAPALLGDNDGLQAALDEVNEDGLAAQLHEAGEVCAALGGAYLRVVWDADHAPLPWVDVVHHDAAAPEFRWGRLQAVTFWRVLGHAGSGRLRLLERHEPGRILHGLYSGTVDRLGRAVPLSDHPDSEHLALLVDAEGGIDTGTGRLTAAYVPNMLPNRQFRGSPLGQSDYQGITPLLDALDETYSSWHRDIRLAKSRLHVPATWLETDGPGTAGIVDVDRELYVPVNALERGNQSVKDSLQAQQFTIRFQEHAATVADWTAAAIRSAGYSSATFGDYESGSAMTATEVKARERRSYLTRAKKVRYWRPALTGLLETLVEVANANLSAGIPEGTIDVRFSDAISETQIELAGTAQALRAAEAASTATLVHMVNPSWTQDQVDVEVAAINAASGLPDPTDVGL